MSPNGFFGGMLDRLITALDKESPGAGLALYRQSIENLEEAASRPALPGLIHRMNQLQHVMTSLGSWAESHPKVGGAIMDVIGVVGVGGNALVHTMAGMGAMMTMAGAGWTGLGKGIGLITKLPTLLRTATVAVRGFATAEALANVLNPFAWVAVAIAALGVLAYEVYEHWAGIKAALSSGWNWMKGWGAAIWDALTWPFTHLAGAIRGIYGDVKSALAHVPVIGHMFGGGESVSSGSATASAMSSSTARAVAPRAVSAAAGAAMAAMVGATPAIAGTTTVIHHSPAVTVNVNGGDPEQVKKAVKDALAESGHELHSTIARENAKRARLSF